MSGGLSRWCKASAGCWAAGIVYLGLAAMPSDLIAAAPRPRGLDDRPPDSEKQFLESATRIPPYPRDAELMEFHPHGNSKNRFFVHPASLSIGTDRAIRYTVVVVSPNGVVNASFEAMLCKTAQYKVFALGTGNREWSALSNPDWRDIDTSRGGVRFRLFDEYFCDQKSLAGETEKDLLRNLTDRPRTGFGENWQKKTR